MSYVVQNFYDCNHRVAITPRLRFIFILTNLNKFFIFMKFNSFFFNLEKTNLTKLNISLNFVRYFFSRQYIKLIYKMNLLFVGNYDNNFTRSVVYYTFYNIERFVNPQTTVLDIDLLDEHYLFNYYFLPIKTINTKINKHLYKNVFFYFMLLSPFLWQQKAVSLRFYLNFIFTNFNLRILRFYSGYFLKIYNF